MRIMGFGWFVIWGEGGTGSWVDGLSNAIHNWRQQTNALMMDW